MPVKHRMDFFMQTSQLRQDLRVLYPRGVYTLELVRDGKRTATTRDQPLGQVGDRIILYNSTDPVMMEVEVRITAVEALNIRDSQQAEAWSKKEGWSADYLLVNILLLTAWQTSFEVVG